MEKEGYIYIFLAMHTLFLLSSGYHSALLLVGPAPPSGNPPCFEHAYVHNNYINCGLGVMYFEI